MKTCPPVAVLLPKIFSSPSSVHRSLYRSWLISLLYVIIAAVPAWAQLPDPETNDITSWSITLNGNTYQGQTEYKEYSYDQGGSIVSSTWDYYSSVTIYTGPNGNGAISGSETGYIINGNWYVNTYGNFDPGFSGPPFYCYSFSGNTWVLWQRNYTFSGGSWSVQYDSNGSGTYSASASFNGDGGAWLSGSGDGSGNWSFSGWDPVVGDFSIQLANSVATVTAAPRTAPSFASRQFFCNGVMTTWMSGIADDSSIIDTYVMSNGLGMVMISRSDTSYDPALVTVIPSWNIWGEVSGSFDLGTQQFSVSGYNLEICSPRSSGSPRFSSGTSVWVNATEYSFSGGYDSPNNDGYGVDAYISSGGGYLSVSGTENDGSQAVVVSWNGGNFVGGFTNQAFSVSGLRVYFEQTTTSLPGGFWVNGQFYAQTAVGGRYYLSAGGNYLLLDGDDAESFYIYVADLATNTIFGEGPENGSGGIFTLSAGGVELLAYPAGGDGAAVLVSGDSPEQLPSGVSVPGRGVWTFLGVVANDAHPDGVAYYGDIAAEVSGTPAHDKTHLLAIGVADAVVTLLNLTDQSAKVGSYDPGSHLFRSSRSQPLPMPICGVDTAANNVLWGLPSQPGGLPPTVVAGGEIWRFSGLDGSGNAIYAGYYPDETMTLGQQGSDGSRGVTLTDSHGTRAGMYRDGVFTMQSGNRIFGGDTSGNLAATSAVGLQTIASNLDITGDVISFGSWTNDPSMAGTLLQYSERFTLPGAAPSTDNSALVYLTGTRMNTSWLWNHAVGSDGAGTRAPMMLLSGADHTLKIYDLADAVTPAIVLSPSGQSRFKKGIHIDPQGDISMGDFSN